MKKTFAPGLAVIHFEYNQGTSGGGIIDPSGNTEATYLDTLTGTYYFWDDEGESGTGWYWYTDEDEGFYGPELPPGVIIVEEP